MKLTYLKQISDDIINQYIKLVDVVIKGTHSIGFVYGLDYDAAREFLESTINKPRAAVLLLYKDKELIGSGVLEETGFPVTEHYARIMKVMVHPEHQKKSIGKKIMTELEDRARAYGFTHIVVSTWDVKHIMKFYKDCGYKQVGVIPEFVKYKGKLRDSHNFTKKL